MPNFCRKILIFQPSLVILCLTSGLEPFPACCKSTLFVGNNEEKTNFSKLLTIYAKIYLSLSKEKIETLKCNYRYTICEIKFCFLLKILGILGLLDRISWSSVSARNPWPCRTIEDLQKIHTFLLF